MANGYRPRIEPPQTAWARHIDAYMQRERLSTTEAFELVGPALGLGPKSRAAFRPFLIDREPDEREAAALASVFGWPDPEPVAVEAEPAPDMASALLALATSTGALAAELAEARRERQELAHQVAVLTATVDRLVAGALAPAGTPAPATPAVPHR